MAVVLRGSLPDQVIFHADRGTQYTCTQIADLCTGLGLLQSVGRTGVCWDCQSFSTGFRKNLGVLAGAV